jgi:hypothetical protein
MKKWTTGTRMATTATTDVGAMSGVSLHRVLQVRRRPLNEIEIWSLLGQASSAARDNITNAAVTICPKSVICTPSGRIALQAGVAATESYYLHPTLCLARRELTETEVDAVAVFSLARTAERCLDGAAAETTSDTLRSLLSRMQTLDVIKSLSLASVHESVSAHWRRAVGATPISRFISQLCKMTVSWQSSVPSLAVRISPPLTRQASSRTIVCSSDAIETNEVEVEFSRLETSSSSSCSADEENNKFESNRNEQNQQQQMSSPFAASMPNLNNNVEKVTNADRREERLAPNPPPPHPPRGPYGRRLAYQPPINTQQTYENIILRSNLSRGRSASTQHIKSTAAVRRNPSRLYRVVKPLTECTPTPSPATKRCIGPEFVVMNENDPIAIDLHCSNSRSSSSASRQVEVVLLTGQRVKVLCNPVTVTAGEVLDNIVSHEDIRETAYYSLAMRASHEGEEYWCLASEVKLSKVAPGGWKQPQRHPNSMSSDSVLVLHLRFRHHPDDVDEFKDPNNKHLFYLQLRKDVSEARYHMSSAQHLGLAAKALQTEFGDFSEDIHGEGDYFLLEHYLPAGVIAQLGETDARRNLTKLHRAHLGQSQSKTEIKYVKEVQRSDNYGFHNFSVRESKKPISSPQRRKHLGIHLQGVFLFETSVRDRSSPHKMLGSFFWHSISRIQYDKTRFQISVQQKGEPSPKKVKFYVSEVKAKVMFDLASAHHKYYMQNRWRPATSSSTSAPDVESEKERAAVEYREPKMRSLKNRLLSKSKTPSQRRLYTKASTAITGGSLNGKRATSAKLLVKRLTHYASMADAAAAQFEDETATLKTAESVRLNESDKENQTPNTRMQSYRYKFYLEPEEDDGGDSTGGGGDSRQPLQEIKPIAKSCGDTLDSVSSGTSTPPPPPPPRRRAGTVTASGRRSITSRKRISTLPSSAVNHQRRRSETTSSAASVMIPSSTTSTKRSHGRRSVGGGGGAGPRMGTRTSLSALHRERLRLTTDMCLTNPMQLQPPPPPPMPKRSAMDLDYDTMETKSLFPLANAAVVLPDRLEFVDDEAASLSESLIDRFDKMEAEDSEPERKIVSVTLARDPLDGRLGLKITGTPSGVYVDTIEGVNIVDGGKLISGDRLVAVNGRSLENVAYAGVLELIRKSERTVSFLVSQISS